MEIYFKHTNMNEPKGQQVQYLFHVSVKEAEIHPTGNHVYGIKCGKCEGALQIYGTREKWDESKIEYHTQKYGQVWKFATCTKTVPYTVIYNPDVHCKHCGAQFITAQAYAEMESRGFYHAVGSGRIPKKGV